MESGSENIYSYASGIAVTTDPRTANQIQEISNKMNTGAENFEIGSISPEIFESIPQQHLKEINRLTRLTGTSASVHGPIIEAFGYTREGWNEQSRQAAERQMMSAVERSHEINPDGNIPVTFHSTAMLPETEEKVMIEEKGEKKEVIKSALIIDPETGKIGQLRERKRYFPGQLPTFNVKAELKEQNNELWSSELTHITFNTTRGVEAIESAERVLNKETYDKIKSEKLKIEDLPPPEQKDYEHAIRNINYGDVFLREGYRELKEIYNKAFHNADEEDRKKLSEFAKEVEQNKEKIDKDPMFLAQIMEKGVQTLRQIETPQTLKPLNEFFLDKSSETFANVAFNAYEKFGSNAPIVSIENPPAGSAFSRAEDLKNLIEETRKKFAQKAVKEGYSKSEAEKAAAKLIGATWDVGHINMLRKYGYEKPELLKQTETIAPFVKHVHLSDNFGLEHTELPMGMGNVPFKEILAKLGKEGFEGKKVIEAGNWFQHFKTMPLPETLEAMGSPLYPMLAQPSWRQIYNTQGIYSSGYGLMLPDQHFSIYGAGFTSLPTELGGQIPGKQSRLSGTPNA